MAACSGSGMMTLSDAVAAVAERYPPGVLLGMLDRLSLKIWQPRKEGDSDATTADLLVRAVLGDAAYGSTSAMLTGKTMGDLPHGLWKALWSDPLDLSRVAANQRYCLGVREVACYRLETGAGA